MDTISESEYKVNHSESRSWRTVERACLREYALHTAYWKYVVRRRITGGKRGTFVLQGSNFFARPVETTEAAWKHDLEILVTMHQDLRYAVVHLDRPSPEIDHMIRGAAAHDLYHAGQIRLLRRMLPRA